MFFQLLQQHQVARGESAEDLQLPMTRSDVADYLGMSLEAVSRSFRTLANRGIVSLGNRRSVKVLNRGQLDALAALTGREEKNDCSTDLFTSSRD